MLVREGGDDTLERPFVEVPEEESQHLRGNQRTSNILTERSLSAQFGNSSSPAVES